MDTLTLSGLQKPVRTGIEKIHAVSLKPADFKEDESGEQKHVTSIVFVDSRHQERRIPCSLYLFQRLEGRRRPKGPHPAMDMRLDKEYLVCVEKRSDVEGGLYAVGIDVFPKIEKRNFKMTPADSEEVEMVTIDVTQATGEVEVKEAPHQLTTKSLIRIINSLDKVNHIVPGQTLGERYPVTSVGGNRLQLDPSADLVG